MNILITGGAGFIGTHTARALAHAGHRVRVLDVLDPQVHGPIDEFPTAIAEVAECVHGDVCSVDDCLRALEGVDAVFHFAARTGVGQSMYALDDYVATNVQGTAALLQAVIDSRRPLQRFVLASSRAIYGEGLYRCSQHGLHHPPLRAADALRIGDFAMRCPMCRTSMQPVPTPPSCPAAPLSVYALSKRHQEEYCDHAARTFDLPLVTLRYFNVYGSLQSLRNPYTGVASIFYSLLNEGRSISLYEQGLPMRDFVHVADVVQANLLALEAVPSSAATFNIGSGVMSTIGDVAQALARAMGVEARLENRGEYRVGDVFACVADLTATHDALGYRPKFDLAAGMAEFVMWARQQSAIDLYDETVSQLQSRGLFGRATHP